MTRLLKKSLIPLLLLIWGILTLGCQKHFDDLDELEQYLKGKDSPFVQIVVKNGIKVTVRYLPTQAMMIPAYRRYLKWQTEIQTDTPLTPKQRQEAIQQEKSKLAKQEAVYNRALYFSLTIGYEDESRDIVYQSIQSGFGQYSQWLQKLLFGLQEYIYLQTFTIDEIPLDTYHMERTFGMSKTRTLLLMFPAEFNNERLRQSKELEMIIKEFGLGAGRLKFGFSFPSDEIKFSVEKNI